MPSSLIHLRVCDRLLRYLPRETWDDFIVGNIAPDCGERIPGTKRYEPPRNLTHFTLMPQRWNTRTHPAWFYETCMMSGDEPHLRAFKLGVYCHLVTDNRYIEDIYEAYERKFGSAFLHWAAKQVKKEDGVYLDALYLKSETPYAVKRFLQLEGYAGGVPPYYPSEAITRRMGEIRQELQPGEPVVPAGMLLAPDANDRLVSNSEAELKPFMEREAVTCRLPAPASPETARCAALRPG